MKQEIIANLREFNSYHGIIFTSEQDAESYYKELVEIIEKLALQHNQVPTGSTIAISIDQLRRFEKEMMDSLDIVSDTSADHATLRIEKENVARIINDIFYPLYR